MMIQHLLPVLRRLFTVWLGILVGIGMFAGCGGGGGGGGGTPPGSANSPTVSIASPTGTYFKEGENIAFSGSATSVGGSQLTGSALVWSSSVDGQIGTGETLITSALSAGDHDITLKATDAAGATATATLPTVSVASTRFIKMGALTTGVPDASNAFDGDENTAAAITSTDTEFIYFKAYLGSADTFIFRMKLGVSTSGSKLALQGLSASSVWEPVGEYGLDSDQTVMVRISNAQNYLDAEGYINLRVCWENGAGGDSAPVYEIWRIDPPYAGSQTTGVDNAVLAFDADASTPATILQPWDSSGGSILHFKAFVGTGVASTFAFTIQLNSIDQFQTLYFDAMNLATSAWETKASLILNTSAARTVTIPIAADHLDADGYVSMRARWVNGGLTTPPGVNVYEIQRVDSFYMDSRTTDGIQDAENAVDQDRDSYAIMHNYWGENDHYDTLNTVAYLGDASTFTLSIKTAQSMNGYTSELIVEGENSPDAWSEIERIPLSQDTPGTDVIELLDARQYVNADGWLSLRVRWEDHSPVLEPLVNGYIYEIWPGQD